MGSKPIGSQAETVEAGARGEGCADVASGQGEDYSERVGGLVQNARRHPCQGLSIQVYLWEERCMGRNSFFKSVATPVLSSKSPQSLKPDGVGFCHLPPACSG